MIRSPVSVLLIPRVPNTKRDTALYQPQGPERPSTPGFLRKSQVGSALLQVFSSLGALASANKQSLQARTLATFSWGMGVLQSGRGCRCMDPRYVAEGPTVGLGHPRQQLW